MTDCEAEGEEVEKDDDEKAAEIRALSFHLTILRMSSACLSRPTGM